MKWIYGESDPAMMLFTAAQTKFRLDCADDAHILELGCAETDFLERFQAQNPSYRLTGVDCYAQPRLNVVSGDACEPDLFPPESFDAVVLLGALEHFGLGFYGDPVHEDGDTITMQNIARWLKPGGWVYFDVPCNPTGYVTENRHFRVFSPEDVTTRLIDPSGLTEVARGYSWPEPWAGTWCEEPKGHLVPYWFVAVHAVKA
jgi:SAM-dependent methyltransferase